MADYATTTDATDLYGEDYVLTSADRDEVGVVDATAFGDALTQATSELNSYIGARYDLPLITVPAVLVRFCVDIAIYVSSTSPSELTVEKIARYKAAIKWALGVAAGNVSLGTDDPAAGVDEDGGTVLTSPVASDRIFTRSKMVGLL